MIKFFRQIRQKLLTENKFSKYLLYAIGEIILVVIGILIALQINNQNENKKTLHLEKDLLREVKSGLEYDLDQLKEAIDFHRLSIESQDIIVDWIEGNIDYNDSLGIHFVRTIFNRNLKFKEAPYETLQQMGLRIIKNDSLRNQISNLYDLVYQDMHWWQDEYEKIKTRFGNLHGNFGFEIKGTKRSLDKTFAPIDTLKLKSDKTYIFELQFIRANLDIYTNSIMIDGQVEIEKTIQMVNKEIEEK